jgi:hypothetical protein
MTHSAISKVVHRVWSVRVAAVAVVFAAIAPFLPDTVPGSPRALALGAAAGLAALAVVLRGVET